MNEQIIRLAVQRAHPTPDSATVALVGVPGCQQANVQVAQRSDGLVRAVVTGLDNQPLHHHDWIVVDLEPRDDWVVGARGTRWYPVPPDQRLMPEPQSIDATDQDIVAMVDTQRNCWVLTCPECGRLRYAARNNVRKVYACRICTKRARRQYKNEWQRRQRCCSSPPTTTPPTTDAPVP